MRKEFVEALLEIAARDSRVWLLTGDLGFGVLEPFRDRFPDRFVNAGVAEQNMIGVAAGLAHAGNVVFAYSIANFGTFRCLEQIRNDVLYHRLDVKIVCVGGGVAYGPHGYSHHAVEDVAMMRALPGMCVVAPGDPLEARLATAAVADCAGPAYLRLGRGGEPKVHHGPIDFRIGRAIVLRPPGEITLIATGAALAVARDAADRLGDAGLLSMPTIAPLDECAIGRVARASRVLATVEEHGPTGGLFEAVCASLAAQGTSIPVRRFSLSADPHVIGSQAFIRARSGLTGEQIAADLAHTRAA